MVDFAYFWRCLCAARLDRAIDGHLADGLDTVMEIRSRALPEPLAILLMVFPVAVAHAAGQWCRALTPVGEFLEPQVSREQSSDAAPSRAIAIRRTIAGGTTGQLQRGERFPGGIQSGHDLPHRVRLTLKMAGARSNATVQTRPDVVRTLIERDQPYPRVPLTAAWTDSGHARPTSCDTHESPWRQTSEAVSSFSTSSKAEPLPTVSSCSCFPSSGVA